MNKKPFVKKYSLLTALGYTILMSLFAALATVIAAIVEASEIQTMLIQTGGFLLSIILASVIMIKTPYTLREYGIQILKNLDARAVLWFAPLVVVEAITIFVGIETSLSSLFLLTAILLMFVVVINEETYFRGLILKTLTVKGTAFAIIVSSVLFGLVHVGGLIVGRSAGHIILLITFSMLYGFVSAEIVVLTGSILVPIIWHFIHNMVSIITAEASPELTLIIVGVQSFILLLYAVYLWRDIQQKNNAGIKS